MRNNYAYESVKNETRKYMRALRYTKALEGSGIIELPITLVSSGLPGVARQVIVSGHPVCITRYGEDYAYIIPAYFKNER